MSTHKTPADCIANVSKIRYAVAHLLNAEGEADFDAVLAMAERDYRLEILDSTPMTDQIDDAYDKALLEWGRADDAAKTALLAAGVEVENG